MEKLFLLLLFLMVAGRAEGVDVTYQDGTDSYTGTTCQQIKEIAPTTSYPTADKTEITYYQSNDRTNTLLKFDLSAIPAGSTISSVQIQLYQYASSGTNTLYCHRMLRNWTASATWNTYDGSNAWGTVGGFNNSDRSSTLSASVSVGGTNGQYYSFGSTSQLVTDVQNFIDGTWSNYGWWFYSEGLHDTWHSFRSDEFGTVNQRPKILISYTADGGVSTRKTTIILGE